MVRNTVSIIIMAVLFQGLAAANFPAPSGYVNDGAGVLTSAQAREIEAVASSLKAGGNIELAVVTVPSIQGMAIEDYSIGLAEAWGVGTRSEDLGIILLLAVQERQVRIEVGYGLEGDIPDGLAGDILDTHVIPEFRRGNWGQGLLNGSRAIAATLADRREFTLPQQRLESYAVRQSSGFDDLEHIFFVLMLLLVIFGRGRLWPLLFLSRRGRYYRGGGFGSSSRRGGFGGFGGGGFGGGGASRSF